VLTLVGRHTGAAFGGVEPEGHEIAAHHIWIMETDSGVITSIREEWDRLGLLRQLRGEDAG
jgi:hypothetical protein